MKALAVTIDLLAALLGVLAHSTRGYPILKRPVSNVTSQPSYQLQTGDGTSWPSKSQWVSFDYMWASNQALINSSCTQYHQPNNSKDQMSNIRTAAVVIAILSGVDERFILATILQESGGCVRAPTSNNGVINPGLMQTHNGSGTCENLNPCPMSMIKLMVTDGSVGTNFGDGLKGCISRAVADGASDATAIYQAARIYNTGSYHTGADLGTPVTGLACYRSDIANRLTGWSELKSPCTLPNLKK